VPSADGEPVDGSRRRAIVAIAIVSGVVALDQLTKVWAVARLDDGPISLFGQDVQLRLSRNRGGAFSLFQGFTPLLAVLAVVLAVLLVRALRRTDDMWMVVALALVLGGASGNLIDRMVRDPGLLRGAVIDFVRLDGWPTFNVADSAITIGAIVLVVRALLGGREERIRPEST
jgi:signal peptidase II